MQRRATASLFVLLFVLPVLWADALAQTERSAELRVESTRLEKDPPESLRFLRDNRDFLRARLDRLRTSVHWRDLDARPLSEHQRWLRDTDLARIAAEDSLDREQGEIARRDLLDRIEDLAAVEAQLDRLEGLVDAQAARLTEIAGDYAGRQETAVALLATGLPDEDLTALLVENLDGETVRVRVDAALRAALAGGALTELLHEFVEPRSTSVQISMELADGSRHPLGSLDLQPVRDRLNFVRLDFASAEDGAPWTVTSWLR
jgi:hypothetical protein